MDKLGTYALVAALTEISKKSVSVRQTAQGERWVSLREVEGQSLDAPGTSPAQEMLPPSPGPSAPQRRAHSYIREVDIRHQNARKLNKQ